MGLNINFATGFELPPFWLQNKEVVRKLDENSVFASHEYISRGIKDDNLKQELMGVRHFDKIEMKFENEPNLDENWYTLPLDPVISVTGKNIIARRNVAKINEDTIRRGSVKEIWSQGDYEVNIAGVLIGSKNELPENDLRTLKNICEARQAISIKSRLLEVFGIFRITIEDFSFPFTKGLENQMYTIKAYSDDKFDLLIKDMK
ncbi:MAG: DUF6046 domain-containing protein [Prevotellaceae bacterium]|jgi:hypothetical protein|nr:DUF6046 domain-containing protein [Prevotellaceae bacterium]